MGEYILYLAQQANFQTRSILIPAADFLAVRSDDYHILKNNSVKNYKFNIDGREYLVDNLLLDNIIWDGNMGRHEKAVYTEICADLKQYADGMEDDQYIRLEDKAWYDNSKINLCKGFNHIKNFVACKKKLENQGIKIIDAFLVLETDHGKYQIPDVDTVEEMFEKYYSDSLDQTSQ